MNQSRKNYMHIVLLLSLILNSTILPTYAFSHQPIIQNQITYIDDCASNTLRPAIPQSEDKGKQREEELEKRIETLQEKAAKATSMSKGLKSYTILAKWYENMLLEVPKIKKKNSGLIKVQSWENAMECYIYDHPKPKVDEFTFTRD